MGRETRSGKVICGRPVVDVQNVKMLESSRAESKSSSYRKTGMSSLKRRLAKATAQKGKESPRCREVEVVPIIYSLGFVLAEFLKSDLGFLLPGSICSAAANVLDEPLS